MSTTLGNIGLPRALAGITVAPASTVLVGRLDGVGVVPTVTPLTRLNYFDGRFLRADDLQLDQRYVRALVAESNRAGGSGVVHGFDVSATDGSITVGAGLAISPTGRVIYLPGVSPTLSVEDIIAASQGRDGVTESVASAGRAGFADCELLDAPDDATFAPVADAWVITVGPAEAACGDEDVYGRLCEDACVTDSQKSHLVDGVAVRMVPLELTVPLPQSASVPDDPTNLRSRLAIAYYRSERRRVADLRSAAGLQSPAWCLGAPAEFGDTVPIALLVRGGGRTQFVDPWTVRREIFEPPPARYWAWRTGRRPMAVFMAQVLQFQCQLIGAVTDGTEPGAPNDPCADERAALADASGLLNEVETVYESILERAIERLDESPKVKLTRFAEVRAKLLQAVATAGVTGSNTRRLIRHGFVGAPPAGFVSVNPGARSVEDDVRAWFGEGVDLRFCVARPDVIARAFEDAQHLDRISLTAGLDDPAAKHEVDVLVPDGVIERDTTAPSGTGLRASIDLFPDTVGKKKSAGAAELEGGGQLERLDNGGIALAIGASGAAPERLPVGSMVEFIRRAASAEAGDEEAATLRDRVVLTDAKALRDIAVDPEVVKRLEGVAWAARKYVREEASLRRNIDVEREVEPLEEFRVDASTKRPLGWFSALRFGADAGRLQPNQSVPVSFEIVGAAPAIDLQALMRTTLSGSFTIEQVNPIGNGYTASGRLVGPGSWLTISDGKVTAESGRHVSLPMTVVVGTPVGAEPSRVEVMIALDPKLSRNTVGHQLVLSVRIKRNPDRASGALLIARDDNLLGTVDLKSMVASSFSSVSTAAKAVFGFQLIPDQGVLTPGNEQRNRALRGVEFVAAMLAEQDPGFTERALSLLFPRPTSEQATERIRATRDWVMFHRRAERTCLDERRPVPVPDAAYRLLHAAVDSLEEAEQLRRLIAAGQGAGQLDDIGVVEFEGGTSALTTSETALLGDWQQAQPGNVLRYAMIAPTLGDARLAAQRLRRVGRALSSVTQSVADTVTESLPSVPGGIEARDADGVIVAITLLERRTTCHSVWLMGREAAGQIKQGMLEAGLDRLIEAGAVDEVGEVVFDADSHEVVSGIDELVEKLGDRPDDIDPLAVVYSTPGNAEAGPVQLRRKRALTIAEGVGYEDTQVTARDVGDLPGGCPAATLIVERPVGSCMSVFIATGDIEQLAVVEEMIAGGDIAGVVALDTVASLGTLSFQAGNLDVSDMSALDQIQFPDGVVSQLVSFVASQPEGDPEPTLLVARAEVATELAVNATPAKVVQATGVETFPDVDCPSVVVILAARGVFNPTIGFIATDRLARG